MRRTFSYLGAIIAASLRDGILRGADNEFLFHVRHNGHIRLPFGLIRDTNRPLRRPPKNLEHPRKKMRTKIRAMFWNTRVLRGK